MSCDRQRRRFVRLLALVVVGLLITEALVRVFLSRLSLCAIRSSARPNQIREPRFLIIGIENTLFSTKCHPDPLLGQHSIMPCPFRTIVLRRVLNAVVLR